MTTRVVTRPDGSFTDALSRFDKQTEELKRLLAEEELAATSDSEEGEDDEESGDEEEGSDEESSDDEDSDEEDSDCYTDSDSDDDSDYEDLVKEFTVPGANAGPVRRMNSSPALMAIAMQMESAQAQENVLPGFINLKDRMRRSSGSYLQSPEYTTETKPETVANPFAATRPEEHLKSILEGFSASHFPSETWHGYFKTMTDENVEAHTIEVEQAIRNHDYAALRQMLRNGRTLQTCNKHGESIVHIACRRGTTELVQFLLHEASVNPRIRDDMGRTPLHDVCWTHKPNFEIVMELLQETPELLFIVDRRGFTPLNYVPREAWGTWCQFLEDNRLFLRDMVKSLRFDRARYFIKTMVPCLKF